MCLTHPTRRQIIAALAGTALADPRITAQPTPARNPVAGFQTTAMLILREGKAIFEFGDLAHTSYIASARKSVVSMLYGPAVAAGKIDLKRTLAQIGLDDIGGLLPRERQATIRDLLMARSGVYHKAANSGDAGDLAPPRGSVQPGSYFLYNNWDFNALGTIYERETGRDFYQAFGEDIAAPIGLRDYRIEDQPVRNDTHLSEHPARHFVLSTRDMVALGQLMLEKGKWHGHRIISAEWVARTTSLSTSAAETGRTSPFVDGLGYGWLWWIFDPAGHWPAALQGAYTASGAGGQFITVAPRVNMVIAHKVQAPSPLNVRPEDYLRKILPAALALK